MKRLSEYIAACSALCLTLMSATPADAGDEKYYPAFMCIEAGSAPSGTVNKSEFRITKTAGAQDAKSTMLCPIVHDTFENGSFGGPTILGFDNVHVDVFDSILLQDVSCALIARDRNGGQLFFETNKTKGASTTVQKLSFAGGTFAGLGFDANYYLKCDLPTNNLPQAAKIISYHVEEN